MVIKEATTPEQFLGGGTTQLPLVYTGYLFMTQMFKEQNSHKWNCLCGGGVMSSWDTPHPTPVSTVSNALRILPRVFQPVDLGPAKSSSWAFFRLPARLPGASLAVTWCLPSRQTTPQSSAHLHHLCVAHLWRPPPTKPLAAPEEVRAPSRLRQVCSALLK